MFLEHNRGRFRIFRKALLTDEEKTKPQAERSEM